jgi:tetratricopeptide (TPR) repeat protein
MNVLRASAFSFAIACVCAGAARAQAPEVAQSKGFFKAGAAAYEMGDYSAAIQALDAAYRLTPLPAIAFSLAQAERRQYFVSRDRAHLERAVGLFRTYLAQMPTGGRRADAIDALAQLEPLAVTAPAPVTDATSQPIAAVARTRIMIASTAKAARVSLDGEAVQPAPLIAEVSPGTHRVSVTAPGFFPSERTLEAIEGEFVPIEVALRRQPAVVDVRATPDARLYVDGAYLGNVGAQRSFELSPGSHRFSFAQDGHRVETVQTVLEAGATQTLSADLRHTGQRSVSLGLLVVSGASFATGGVMTALAIVREHEAQAILDSARSDNISAGDLSEYGEAVRARDRFRVAAAIGLSVSLASFATGLLLFLFDQPDLQETRDREPGIRFGGPAGAGVTGRF